MGIRFRCHHCQCKLNIKSELGGKRGICPHCSGRFRIPTSDQHYSIEVATGRDSSGDVCREDQGDPEKLPQTRVAPQSSVKLRLDGQENPKLYLVRPPSGGIYGPADLTTIAGWIGEQRITADTTLAPVGSNDWVEAEVFFPESFSAS